MTRKTDSDARTPGRSLPSDDKTDAISLALRRMHESVVAEDVPVEFLDLLAEIDRKLDSQGSGHDRTPD